MPVTDTSWLIALFSEDDLHHEKAVAKAHHHGPYLIPQVILGEFLSILHHRLDGRTARTVFHEIKEEEAFRVVADCDTEAVGVRYLRRPSLSYADCVAIQVAVEHAEELLTFDQKQARAARRG